MAVRCAALGLANDEHATAEVADPVVHFVATGLWRRDLHIVLPTTSAASSTSRPSVLPKGRLELFGNRDQRETCDADSVSGRKKPGGPCRPLLPVQLSLRVHIFAEPDALGRSR